MPVSWLHANHKALENVPAKNAAAPEHVARLISISRLACTCKILRLHYLNKKEKYNPSNQIWGYHPLDDLDNWEKCTSIRLSSLCLFSQKPDSNTCPYSVKSSISNQSIKFNYPQAKDNALDILPSISK